MNRMYVYQDGADFYEDSEDAHGVLWTAPFEVTDHDTKGAEEACALFCLWCATQGISPVF